MAVITPEEKIEKACISAKEKLESLGIEDQIQAELEYVIGSYNFDKNPVGLYEIGGKAFKALEAYKTEHPGWCFVPIKMPPDSVAREGLDRVGILLRLFAL